MIQNIVLIGAGKLATQLGKYLVKKGYNIRQVYSKELSNAELLAEQLNAYSTDQLKQIQNGADLYIISVTDAALSTVINQLPSVSGIVVHTAGSLSLDMLIKFDKYGILYPFQTFSKEREVDFQSIPLLLEANSEQVYSELSHFGKTISKTVIESDSNQRQQIHLAAVFACNFTNHMYAIADGILKKNHISFDVIKPLIVETAHKVEELTPVQAQTGPAVRGDENVLGKHLQLLSDDHELRDLYKNISKRIEDLNQ